MQPLQEGGRPSGLGLRPRAATARWRMRAGSGQHRASARPLVLPNAAANFKLVKKYYWRQSNNSYQSTKFIFLMATLRGCAQRMHEACRYRYPAAPRRGLRPPKWKGGKRCRGPRSPVGARRLRPGEILLPRMHFSYRMILNSLFILRYDFPSTLFPKLQSTQTTLPLTDEETTGPK